MSEAIEIVTIFLISEAIEPVRTSLGSGTIEPVRLSLVRELTAPDYNFLISDPD